MSKANAKYFLCLLLSAVFLFCGCDKTDPDSQISSETSKSTSSQTQTQPTEITEEVYISDAENDDVPYNPNANYWITQDADTKYDDDTVPEEWIPICTAAEALRRFDEIAYADTSATDTLNAVCSLVNRNVLLFETRLGHTFDIDWSESYTPEKPEAAFHPITLHYFSDLDSISKLVYSTYNSAVADEFLFGENKTRPLFAEDNGRYYVNVNALSNWSCDPFLARSYIEITEISDDCCNFIWHYPDREELNEPDKYKYFYFDKEYTASFVDGAWVLDSIILNN